VRAHHLLDLMREAIICNQGAIRAMRGTLKCELINFST